MDRSCSRELASLRVLGFSRAEVSRLLLGEQGMLTLVALPLGFALGYRLCQAISLAYQWDLFRMPLIVTRDTGKFSSSRCVMSSPSDSRSRCLFCATTSMTCA